MTISRNRRRILIAALAVVGILCVWWAQRGTLDQRFVGTWQLNGDPRVGVTYSAEGWFVLLRNGKPLWNDKNQKWFVKGNTLSQVISSGSAVGDLQMEALRLYWKLNGFDAPPMQLNHDIAEVQESTFRFVYPGGGEMKWNRVRE